ERGHRFRDRWRLGEHRRQLDIAPNDARPLTTDLRQPRPRVTSAMTSVGLASRRCGAPGQPERVDRRSDPSERHQGFVELPVIELLETAIDRNQGVGRGAEEIEDIVHPTNVNERMFASQPFSTHLMPGRYSL